MSFNKIMLPNEKDYLKKKYKELGHSNFINRYGKYDAYFCGNESNSMFIDEIIYKGNKYIPIWYELKCIIKSIIKKIKRKYVLRSKGKI
jgi:hypothetical protein